MPITPTNWRARVMPTDANVRGEPQPVPWSPGQTKPVTIDLTDDLDAGEVVTNPVSSLKRLPAFGETDYTNAPTLLLGAPVVAGVFVSQQLQNLEAGRIYRWTVQFGASNNRRSASLLVECVE